MKQKSRHLFWIMALFAGFCFDRLFWEKPGGINFFIFTIVAILGGLIPLWMEKIHIPWPSYALLLPIGFFSIMIAFRAEPFTSITNGLITLATVVLLSITAQNGAWFQYTFQDHIISLAKFLLNSLTGGILFFNKSLSTPPYTQPEDRNGTDTDESGLDQQASSPGDKRRALMREAAPYLRGILLTVPVIIVLALLLSAADPVFSKRIQSLFSRFKLENLTEWIFRMVYITIIAYLLLAGYHFSLTRSKARQDKLIEKPFLKPFVGLIEASIMLGSINLLFLLFVILQFTYLFGGSANINLEGFTYAEYARRGFFELLAVGVISLLLFYFLSMHTKRETRKRRWIFSALGVFLVSLVGLILASAYFRLSLYEAAYGFTRLRTLTHAFIIWTGLLLAATAILELRRRMDRFALVLILLIIGFGLTLNLLNVDRFIVERNVTRAIAPPREDAVSELDTGYLLTLSYDSVPRLVDFYKDPQIDPVLRAEIGGVLACRLGLLDQPSQHPWTSTHFSRARAINLLMKYSDALVDYNFDEENLSVEVNGEVKPCYRQYFD